MQPRNAAVLARELRLLKLREQALVQSVLFTDEERARVRALYAREAAATISHCQQHTLSFKDYRRLAQEIAAERVEISRQARQRLKFAQEYQQAKDAGDRRFSSPCAHAQTSAGSCVNCWRSVR